MPGEFRVNGYQDNWQYSPNVAVFEDGSFLVVWDSYFNNYDDDSPVTTYVSSQRYNAFGQPVGSETVISGADGTKSATPTITVLADGGYVVAWQYDDADAILTIDTEIRAKVFNADGSLRADTFRVDTVASTSAGLVSVGARGDGGFTVFFGVERSTDLFDQAYSRGYDADGNPQGSDRLLNTNVGEFDQFQVRSATLTNGTVIAVWNSESSLETGGTLDSNELRATLLAAGGGVVRGDFSLGSNIGTVTSSGTGYDVAALANGGFVISQREWSFRYLDRIGENGTHVLFQLFDAAGNPTTPRLAARSTDTVVFSTRVTQLASGDILVVWEQYSENPGEAGEDIYARVFTQAGVALTSVFEIGQDADSFDAQSAPQVKALPGGGFVVVYESDSIDADHEGIAGRIYGRGTGGDDIVRVDASGSMAGLRGNDALTGSGGRNRLDGGVGNDRLEGAAGADTLIGGAGNDTLSGGTGVDHFLFNAALDGRRNVDSLTDFAPGQDRILLDNDFFRFPAALGTMAASRLAIGSDAADSGDRIIYDPVTGNLFYDRDGTGAGAQVLFATLAADLVLNAGSFLIVD